jgi:hypothetical protein
MTIDMSKKYRTRDGRDVRVYAVDAGGEWSVHGATLEPEPPAEWLPESWTQGGDCYSGEKESPRDLVEVKAEVWVWQFEDGSVSADNKLTPAECAAVPGRTNGRAVRFVQEDEA